jgi:hypothetical protein
MDFATVHLRFDTLPAHTLLTVRASGANLPRQLAVLLAVPEL